MRQQKIIGVVIPALNEQTSIALVLGGLSQVRSVFVIDGHSLSENVTMQPSLQNPATEKVQ